MTLATIVDQHTEKRRSLFEQLMVVLFGLWLWQRTVDDPVKVAGATAATVYYVDMALEAMREQENGYVTAYADEMGVRYSSRDRITQPIYPRDADLIDVYSRFIDEYRWQRYGKENRARTQGSREPAAIEAGASVADRDVRRGDAPRRAPSLADRLADEFEAQFVNEGTSVFDLADWQRQERLEGAELDSLADFDEAEFQAALKRLEKIVGDDLGMVASDEHRQLLAKKKVWVGYRRVIHPELTVSGTCGLCLAASTRIYQKRVLLPMHDGCVCTQMGMTDDLDPAKAMNEADIDSIFAENDEGELQRIPFTRAELDELYATAGSTYAADLLETRITEFEHGEKGTTLAYGRGGRSEKPYREQTLEDTRAMWERTREWATTKRAEAVAARDAATTTPANRADYATVVAHFDDLIARMGRNLRSTS